MAFSLIGTVVDAVVFILSTVGLPGVFALMAVESFGIPPLPSEVILPFTGFLIAEGTFSFGGALAAAVAGGLVGSFAAYAVGRWWRHRLVDIGVGPLRVEARHLDRMDRFFARRGEMTVGISRLVPVVRSYISYPAGTAKMSPVRFAIYTVVGSIPFTVGFLYAGMVLGKDWNVVSSYLRWVDVAAGALVVLALGYLLLLLAGRLTPGWPPRWVRGGANRAPADGPPGGPPSSPG